MSGTTAGPSVTVTQTDTGASVTVGFGVVPPSLTTADVVAFLLARPTTLPTDPDQLWWNGTTLQRS